MRSDSELATALAGTALRLLLDLREAGLQAGRSLGTTGDALANAFLVRTLRALRPDDGLLSEEEKDNPARLAKSRVWVIDPLDGTREYGEGRDDWAVHVALCVDGRPVTTAVAQSSGTVSSDDVKPPPPRAGTPLITVSRTRPPAEAQAAANAIGAQLLPMGSAGAKVMAVVRGEADAYVHGGGQYEWDSAAPVGIALAAGLHASRLDGSPLVYNRPDPYLPDLLVCRAELSDALLAALGVP